MVALSALILLLSHGRRFLLFLNQWRVILKNLIKAGKARGSLY